MTSEARNLRPWKPPPPKLKPKSAEPDAGEDLDAPPLVADEVKAAQEEMEGDPSGPQTDGKNPGQPDT